MIRKQIFGEDHADVARSYNNLALVYYNLKEYNQAKQLQEKALMICKKIFGEDHADVASSYNNLALVYDELGEYNQAKELHEKALMIRKKIFGEDHADVATSYFFCSPCPRAFGVIYPPTQLEGSETETTATQESWRIRNKLFGIWDLADS